MTTLPRAAAAGALLAVALQLTTRPAMAAAAGGAGAAQAPAAPTAPAWRTEFDEVCAKTQDAMALSADELRALVARADRLRPEVERLDPSQRKVFLRRLEACRNLYQFVLDARGKG